MKTHGLLRGILTVGTVAVLLAQALAAQAALITVGPIDFNDDSDYNNAASQTTGLFRDFTTGASIARGNDVGGTLHTALNFTADNTLTVYDTTPADATVKNLITGNLTINADVIIHTFDSNKAPGLVALLNEGTSKKGIVAYMSDGGSSDYLYITTVDQTGNYGSNLASLRMSSISEDVWYRLVMDVTISGDAITVSGKIYDHSTTTDPNSSATTQHTANSGSVHTLTYTGSLTTLGLDTTGTGEVGMDLNRGNGSVSFTNFKVEYTPEPATMALMGLGGLCMGLARMRGRKIRIA